MRIAELQPVAGRDVREKPALKKCSEEIAFLAPGDVSGLSGGIQGFNRSLIAALAECDSLSLTVFLLDERTVLSPLPYSASAKIVPCGPTRFRVLHKLMLAARAIAYGCRYRPPQVICGHVNLLPVCFLLKKLFGTNYILVAHGIEVWNLTGIAKRLVKGASVIWSVSNFTRQKILEQVGNVPIELLPNMVDGGHFQPQPKSLPLMKRYGVENSKVLLTVGRVMSKEGYKGHDQILEALPAVLRIWPRLKYIVVGTGDYLPQLKAKAAVLRVQEHVIFAGYVSDEELPDFYNLCDVYVMPSKGEGFGIVFLEALACGKPVIAGNQDGARDALLDGKLGLLVSPNLVAEIAEAILKLLAGCAGEEFRNSDYLRNTVLEHFGPERFRDAVRRLVA